MANRKFNNNWDSLLTQSQRALIAKPGFGLLEKLPYLPEEEVKKAMTIIEECVKHIDLLIIQE